MTIKPVKGNKLRLFTRPSTIFFLTIIFYYDY